MASPRGVTPRSESDTHMNVALESDAATNPFDGLLTVLPMVGWAASILGILTFVVSAVRTVTAINSYDRRNAAPGIIGGMVLVLIGVGVSMVGGSAGDQKTSDAPEPEPVHEPPAPQGDVGGGELGSGGDVPLAPALLGGVGALIATILAIGAVITLRERIRGRRAQREARAHDWGKAQGVYRSVLDDYAAYLADPYAWLERPILEDVDEPITAAFLEALATTQSLDLDIVPTEQRRIDQFREAAQDLRAAWDKADENARRIGTTIYEERSRKRLRKAAAVLRTALDAAATTEERAAAAATVNRLTDGLVRAPERILSVVTGAIEAARRKELPVGRDQ